MIPEQFHDMAKGIDTMITTKLCGSGGVVDTF
jgi:hypothetical protein